MEQEGRGWCLLPSWLRRIVRSESRLEWGQAVSEAPLHLAVRQAISGELLTTETVSGSTTARQLKEKLRKRPELAKSRLQLLLPGVSQRIEDAATLASLAAPPIGTSAEAPLVLQLLKLHGTPTTLEITHSFSSGRDTEKGRLLYKVVVVGPAQVGKTWLLAKYCDTRQGAYRPTIGADFQTKTLRVDGKFATTLQLWDTAGEERFQALGLQFYRNAQACLLVFDLTSRSSFEQMRRFHDRFLEALGDAETQLVLVGNKADLVEQREVPTQEAEDFASGLNLKYVEVSALADPQGVQRLFEGVTSLMLDSDMITRDGVS